MEEYFELGHAETVPQADLNKPPQEIFYLPMHAVHKKSSTTTKICAVFDAFIKTSTGISLNDTLMAGLTVYPSPIDVLIRFCMHQIALLADISKMYRAIELPLPDRDFHWLVWRSKPGYILNDCRMTRDGVSSSLFVANMAVQQNPEEHVY